MVTIVFVYMYLYCFFSEHPLSVHECQWVSENSPWSPIECAWPPLSEWEHQHAWPPLSHYWMRLTVVWPWERTHLCQNWTCPERLRVHMNACEWVLNTSWMRMSPCKCQWVSIEHPLKTIECAWMPTSEWERPLNTYWVRMNANEWVLSTHGVRMNTIESLLNATHHGVTMRKISFVSELKMPWTLKSVCECLWVSIEHFMNACECTWMPMSENWTPPEHPMSAHERQWVSGNSPWTPIECAWMPSSKYLEGLNVHL
jgi:hypothetical protein